MLATRYAFADIPDEKLIRIIAKIDEFLLFLREETLTANPLVRAFEYPIECARNILNGELMGRRYRPI